MSKYKVTNGINIFVKILSAIIVILLILGIVGGIVYLLNRPKGLFIEYNGKLYFNVDTGGVFPYMIHTDSAAVIERDENSFIISAVVSDVDQTYDKLYEICAEDGRWVLCYDFYVLSDF